MSAGFIPETLDTNSYDGVIRVTSEQALELGRYIGGKEGFLVGISSAAAIYAAIEVAKELGAGKKKSWLWHRIMGNVTFQLPFTILIKNKKRGYDVASFLFYLQKQILIFLTGVTQKFFTFFNPNR